MELFRLTGKTAFVPGGYGAIGAAICRGLARAGARVIVFAKRAGATSKELEDDLVKLLLRARILNEPN